MTLAWFIYSVLFLQPGESVTMPLAAPRSFLMVTAAPPDYRSDSPVLRLVVGCRDRYEVVTGLPRDQVAATLSRWAGECK